MNFIFKKLCLYETFFLYFSTLSGRFPESLDVEELKKNLFEGVDMVTNDGERWPAGIYGLPKRTGRVKDLRSFDATFFGVHAKQANVMDPQLRMLLEVTYEAIVDAGFNPNDVRGSKTGVFIGVSTSESDEFWTRDPDQVNGQYTLALRKVYNINDTGTIMIKQYICRIWFNRLLQSYVPK